jgi:hypothetical protein
VNDKLCNECFNSLGRWNLSKTTNHYSTTPAWLRRNVRPSTQASRLCQSRLTSMSQLAPGWHETCDDFIMRLAVSISTKHHSTTPAWLRIKCPTISSVNYNVSMSTKHHSITPAGLRIKCLTIASVDCNVLMSTKHHPTPPAWLRTDCARSRSCRWAPQPAYTSLKVPRHMARSRFSFPRRNLTIS